jgi:hypothetical protein
VSPSLVSFVFARPPLGESLVFEILACPPLAGLSAFGGTFGNLVFVHRHSKMIFFEMMTKWVMANFF